MGQFFVEEVVLMRRSILILVFVLTVSLTKSSFAELVPEQWCFKCPPGTNLTLIERDRYDCMASGANLSSGAPLWAKPSWAKVVWDVQKGRCQDTYIRFGDEFCYRCPGDYQLSTAVTEYRKEKGNSCKRILGRWEWDNVSGPGRFIEFFENNTAKGHAGTATWQCNDDGSIVVSDNVLSFPITISHDGSSFSGQIQEVTVSATRVQ